MCHVVLLLPIVTLPIFWFVPLPVAAAAYALVFVLSAWVYVRLVQSLHQPAVTGQEALIHTHGEVLRYDGHRLLVRIAGEIWQADCPDRLDPGDPVDIVAVRGLKLVVTRA